MFSVQVSLNMVKELALFIMSIKDYLDCYHGGISLTLHNNTDTVK